MDVASWGAPEEESAWSAPQFFLHPFLAPFLFSLSLDVQNSSSHSYMHTGLLTMFFHIFLLWLFICVRKGLLDMNSLQKVKADWEIILDHLFRLPHSSTNEKLVLWLLAARISANTCVKISGRLLSSFFRSLLVQSHQPVWTDQKQQALQIQSAKWDWD